MNPLEAKSIAEFCKAIRLQTGQSTRDFADNVGVQFTYISKIERGLVNRPMEYFKLLIPYCSQLEKRHLVYLITESIKEDLGL